MKRASLHAMMLCGLVVAAGAASGIVRAAGGTESPAPVYTVEQATAGKTVYARQCASCHMPDLSGNVEYPELAGPSFLKMWGTRSTKELFDYMSAAMPYGQPSLSTDSYTAIAAYILQSNGAAAGPAAFSASTDVPIGSVAMPPTTSSP